VHARFRLAVLLRYAPAESATPRVLQVSVAHMARRIIGDCRRLDIAIVEDSALTEALARCEAGAPIPEALYPRVAELLGGLAIDTSQRFAM
jgi:type III secretion system FlhB-like substrate exporter